MIDEGTADLMERGAFQLGGCVVEPALRRVRSGARSVSLEPKVMRLLVYLADRREEIVGRGDLRRSIWTGVTVVEGVVPRAVYQLRKALAQLDGAGVEVETLRQAGYRLAVRRARRGPLSIADLVARPFRSARIGWCVAVLTSLISLQLAVQLPYSPSGLADGPAAAEPNSVSTPAVAIRSPLTEADPRGPAREAAGAVTRQSPAASPASPAAVAETIGAGQPPFPDLVEGMDMRRDARLALARSDRSARTALRRASRPYPGGPPSDPAPSAAAAPPPPAAPPAPLPAPPRKAVSEA